MFLCPQSNLAAIVLTILVAITTKAQNLTCNRQCGDQTLQFPFGFSEGCEIRLKCSEKRVQVEEFVVRNVTNSNILVDLPAKCNRSMQSIGPLFGENFAPTLNNSFLVQDCREVLGGCVIPASSFVGRHFDVESCDERSSNISCFNKVEQKDEVDVVSYDDLNNSRCKYLFSALSFAQSQEIQLQFQVVELGWWLRGDCRCSQNATCTTLRLHGGDAGFRCHCLQGFWGDGFVHGTGCRKASSSCSASTITSGGCGKATKIGVVVGVIIAGTLVVAGVFLLWYCAWRRSTWLGKHTIVKRQLREAAGDSSVPFYPYKEIEKATSSFSDKHRLGTGAFGTVYAGKLHNDEWVAIKKLRQRDTNSVDQVMNEIKLLSSVSHPNLVRLLGCCIEKGEQILVYEYMQNGTLSQHLQKERGKGLPWTIRLTIATETANVIAYLHSAIHPPIYHRDIKSSNILLDYNFKSKIADFGLSRIGMMETSHISTAPQGTPGYVDPQYHQNFHLSDKSDVYSFGVVLVEIITAMKVVDFARPRSEVNLAALAVDRIRRGTIDEIIDPFLEPHRDAWTLYSIHKVAELAFRCLAFHSDMRPTMMEVAEELEHIRQSGWAAMEETVTASSIGSTSSSPRHGSERSLSGIKKAGHGSERLIVSQKTECLLHSVEVKDSSPVSVHDRWSSGPSSPSSNSLLGNVIP
ncbi:wall-associated receptor kinase-like 14 [Cajanus cajan]|uniref:Wall-associated receptor kinase-like 14 n=1 Tax=Cajanus cajan TaxID=3821 RepID=A0A151TI81_CAJCA|nr:wall-associated receptor kinase-like 14 [Cajanus cajan]KYP66686.1 Wall-associated receptor kinase-like 14 [Cajanus cajan]